MIHQRSARRAGCAAVAAAALTIAMTACSSGGSGSAAVDLSSKAPTGVTITVWHSSADSKAQLALYSAWEKESGNKITFVNLPNDTAPTVVQTKWATGERPDVLEYDSTPQDMAQLDMSQNMIDLSSMPFVKDRLLSSTLGTLNGKTYGAILGPVSVYGEFYNKSVLEKAGVSAPTNATSLLAACTAIKAAEPGVTPISIGGGSQWPAMMLPGFTYMGDANTNNSWGEGVASGKVKVSASNGPLESGLALMSTLKKDGCINSDAATLTYNQTEKDLLAGSAGITFFPSDNISDFYAAVGKTKADATLGFGAFSAKNGVPSYSPSALGSFFAPKTGNAKKERAAADLINWMATTGYQSYVNAAGTVPTFSSAKASTLTGLSLDASKLLQSKSATLAFNMSVPGFGNFGQLAQQVLAGQLTPQAAVTKFQTFVDQAREAQSSN